MASVPNSSSASVSETAEKRRLPKLLKAFWGIGDFGDNFTGTAGGLYGTYFITNVARLPLPLFSVFTMVMSVIDFVFAPMSGILIEKIKPMRWGKLRSWFLVLPPVTAILLIFRFIVWPSPFLIFGVLMVAGIAGAALSNTPNTAGFSLIPSMCAYEDEKAALSSNRIAYAAVGRLVSGFLIPLAMVPLAFSLGNGSYVVIAVVSGVVLVAGYLFQFKLCEGYEGNGMPQAKEAFSFKQMGQAIVSNPHLIPVLFADMTSTLSTFFLPSLLVYMYQYVIQDPGLLATHNLVCSAMAFLGAYLSRYIMQSMEDRRRIAGIIYLCAAVACFSTRFFVGIPALFILVSSLMDFASYCAQPIEGTFYFDCAVYTQWKTGGGNPTALFIGVSTLAFKFISVIRGIILTVLFNVIHFNPDAGPTPEVQAGFTNAYSLVNCVIPLMGFVAITFFYKLSPEILKKCRTEIEARGQELPAE